MTNKSDIKTRKAPKVKYIIPQNEDIPVQLRTGAGWFREEKTTNMTIHA